MAAQKAGKGKKMSNVAVIPDVNTPTPILYISTALADIWVQGYNAMHPKQPAKTVAQFVAENGGLPSQRMSQSMQDLKTSDVAKYNSIIAQMQAL